MINDWVGDNMIEVFGAAAGILYVILEIRQSLWLWPVGVATSAAYIFVFFSARLYADMSLQAYYVVISFLGWYWWLTGKKNGKKAEGEKGKMPVTRVKLRLALILSVVFLAIYTMIFLILSHFTDSPVPGWDALITSLSIVGTWMLARKIYEHWFLWIAVNTVSVILCFARGLYPTAILYTIYGLMSFIGLYTWRKTLVIGS